MISVAERFPLKSCGERNFKSASRTTKVNIRRRLCGKVVHVVKKGRRYPASRFRSLPAEAETEVRWSALKFSRFGRLRCGGMRQDSARSALRQGERAARRLKRTTRLKASRPATCEHNLSHATG